MAAEDAVEIGVSVAARAAPALEAARGRSSDRLRRLRCVCTGGGGGSSKLAEDALEIDRVRAQLEMSDPRSTGAARLPSCVFERRFRVRGRGEQVLDLRCRGGSGRLGRRDASNSELAATNESVLMNGDSPLRRAAISASGSGSPSSTSARRKRSMFALLPRLARDEIFGDEPRLGRRRRPRCTRPPAAPARCTSSTSRPPSTQISTSRISAGMWFGTRVTNSWSTAAAPGQSFSATAVSAASSTMRKPASGSLFGDAPAQLRDLLAARRIALEQPPDDRDAVVDPVAAQPDVGDGEQQLRIVAGRFDRQVFRGGRPDRRAR